MRWVGRWMDGQRKERGIENMSRTVRDTHTPVRDRGRGQALPLVGDWAMARETTIT